MLVNAQFHTLGLKYKYTFLNKTESGISIISNAIKHKYLKTKHRIRLNKCYKLHVMTLKFTIINLVT